MARKRKSKVSTPVERVETPTAPAYDSDSDEDNSYAFADDDDMSTISIDETHETSTMTREEDVRDAIDNLSEERKDVRTVSMRVLKLAMSRLEHMELIHDNIQTITTDLMRIIRDKRDLSQMAFDVLEVLLIAFGYQDDILVELCLDPLLLLCKDVANEAIQASAIHCLSILAYICDIPIEEYEKIHDFFYKTMMGKCKEIVLVASTNAFTLLSTLLSTKAIIEKYYDHVMPFFISLLSKTSSIDVEKAVGQALVYLIDISYEARAMGLTVQNYNIKDVEETMEGIISQKFRGVRRDQIVEHRALFRNFLMTLRYNSERERNTPSMTYKTNQNIVNLTSWKKIIQFNTMKDILHTGIFDYLTNDTVLSDMFGDCLTLKETYDSSFVDKQSRSRARLSYENDMKQAEKIKQQYMSEEFYE